MPAPTKEKTKTTNGKGYTPTKTTPPVMTATKKTTTTTTTTTKTVTHEQIAARAYAIYASGKGGTELQNWIQAERELKAGK